MPNLYLDIETIPTQRPDVLEEIREGCISELEQSIAAVKPPSNYGADAASKWWMEKGNPQITALQAANEAAVEEKYRKTGLDGAFGQVCAIGIAYNDDAPKVVFIQEWKHPDAEFLLLSDFCNLLHEIIAPRLDLQTTVIGHNVASFDLRFLVQRSIVLGIRPHTVIARAAQAKPWETEKVFDTMVQWAGVGKTISLDKLCHALGLPRKGGITGADVWPMVQAGKIQEVADYCAQDVIKTRLAHKRMTFQSIEVLEDVPA
jgi:3'-5' exonuclease